MNQVLRPLIINTPSKMFLFTLFRLLTTGLAVLGVYYVCGLVAAVGTYLIRFVCKRMIYRHCFKRAVAEQTALLLKWQKEDADNSGTEFDSGEMYPICFNAAVEAVNANIQAKSEYSTYLCLIR